MYFRKCLDAYKMGEPDLMRIPANTALLIIDVQKAIDDPVWSKEGPRNNSGAERNISRLLECWRISARPIFHIRHDSLSRRDRIPNL